MQFYDEVKIHIESGRWWDWVASGRRESWIPFWGPDGWDGGKWWNLIIQADKQENTLLPYKYIKNYKADKWEPGRTKDQYGANGKNKTLIVPVWTIIKDFNTGNILYHFTQDKEQWLALKWWEGGRWNIHFKSPILQYPNFALYWEPGDKREIVLELQLLGDVALIGSPSVGKTSLINFVSHTKWKVADYPFTTLIPNLGSVQTNNQHFNIIDIPGIIKWASEWKGLGNQFLRHIIKSRIFCFVCDIARYEEWIKETTNLISEIIIFLQQKFDNPEIVFTYNEKELIIDIIKDWKIILHKKILFLINKYDIVDDEEILKEYEKSLLKEINTVFKKFEKKAITQKLFESICFEVSSFTGHWIQFWLNKCIEILSNTETVDIEFDPEMIEEENRAQATTNVTEQEKEALIEEWYVDEVSWKYSQVWYIKNPFISKLAFQVPWWNDEAENWFWNKLTDEWFLQEFQQLGIQKWDILKIHSFYEDYDHRYILF